MGRAWRGTAVDTTMKLPVVIPALPKPAIARPKISIIELEATPQSSEPSSNKNKDAKYAFLIEYSVKMRPNMGWKAHAVRR
jgi:hypothetical protein